MSEDIRRTRKSKTGDGDMRVGSREWGRGGGWRRNQRRGEREKGKVGGIEIGTEGREESKRECKGGRMKC